VLIIILWSVSLNIKRKYIYYLCSFSWFAICGLRYVKCTCCGIVVVVYVWPYLALPDLALPKLGSLTMPVFAKLSFLPDLKLPDLALSELALPDLDSPDLAWLFLTLHCLIWPCIVWPHEPLICLLPWLAVSWILLCCVGFQMSCCVRLLASMVRSKTLEFSRRNVSPLYGT